MLESELMRIAPMIGTVIISIVAILIFLAGSYTVVPPHEAHVVVSRGKGRKVLSPREGQRSSYWKVPIIQQRAIIPLENIQLQVKDIPLRDKAMAKFDGDVVAWLNINKPLLAAERLGKIERGLESIKADVTNVIRAVTRNMSMYWTIIDIMTKRKDFSEAVEKAVNEELAEWGMRLVELEVIHFTDIEDYTVIKDLETRQASVISAETRKLVAGQDKEASIVEAKATKDTEVARAANEELFRTRQLERDEAVGKRNQEKETAIAEQTKKANEAKIEAEKVTVVGKAKYEKEAVVTKAEGEADAKFKKGEADAKIVKVTGEAEGDAIKAKGFADAAATDKRAEALQKYQEAGLSLEIIKALQTVQIARWDNWGKAMAQAKIQLYAGGGRGGDLFGMQLSPEGGFNIGAFQEIAKEHGFDLEKILEGLAKGTLAVVDIGKAAKGAKENVRKKKSA